MRNDEFAPIYPKHMKPGSTVCRIWLTKDLDTFNSPWLLIRAKNISYRIPGITSLMKAVLDSNAESGTCVRLSLDGRSGASYRWSVKVAADIPEINAQPPKGFGLCSRDYWRSLAQNVESAAVRTRVSNAFANLRGIMMSEEFMVAYPGVDSLGFKGRLMELVETFALDPCAYDTTNRTFYQISATIEDVEYVGRDLLDPTWNRLEITFGTEEGLKAYKLLVPTTRFEYGSLNSRFQFDRWKDFAERVGLVSNHSTQAQILVEDANQLRGRDLEIQVDSNGLVRGFWLEREARAKPERPKPAPRPKTEEPEAPLPRPRPSLPDHPKPSATILNIHEYLTKAGEPITIRDLKNTFNTPMSGLRRHLRTAKDENGKRLFETSNGTSEDVRVWAIIR